MPASFREVDINAGVDEKLPSGNFAGIIVPLTGSNVVKLVGGANLKVFSTNPTMVPVEEISDSHQRAMANQKNPTPGEFRFFRVTGKAVPGLDKVQIQAVDPRTSQKEAILKVLVLRQYVVTISLRPTQVLDEQKNIVSFTDVPFDGKKLIEEMNVIWTPQANIVFQLGKTDPVVIPSHSPKSRGVEINDKDTAKELVRQKDSKAALTAYLVRQAFHGGDVVNGVTDVKDGFALISDKRSPRTLAHEAGHYLGSSSELVYGHPEKNPLYLMSKEGGRSGLKIPYSAVPSFNKGYTTT